MTMAEVALFWWKHFWCYQFYLQCNEGILSLNRCQRQAEKLRRFFFLPIYTLFILPYLSYTIYLSLMKLIIYRAYRAYRAYDEEENCMKSFVIFSNEYHPFLKTVLCDVCCMSKQHLFLLFIIFIIIIIVS